MPELDNVSEQSGKIKDNYRYLRCISVAVALHANWTACYFSIRDWRRTSISAYIVYRSSTILLAKKLLCICHFAEAKTAQVYSESLPQVDAQETRVSSHNRQCQFSLKES